MLGFADFGKRLVELRQTDTGSPRFPRTSSTPAPAASKASSHTATRSSRSSWPSPIAQILYWFAMPFTTPLAWEAVAYYDGREGRRHFADHAVGTGPYRLSLYEKQYRFTLERNEPWYGSQPTNLDAPGGIFPCRSTPRTLPRAASLPHMRDGACPSSIASSSTASAENIPRFNKFLQGYYDDGGIIKESFDAVVQGDRLSPKCRHGACASTRRWSRASVTSASIWRTRWWAHQPASAAASCARP